MSKAIGIDLGTTNSCVAVVEGEQPVIIPNSTGGRTTPSIVAFTMNGERLVGDPARRQLVTNPKRTISSVKRHMGSEWQAEIDGTAYKPQVISAMILTELKKDAEDFLGDTVTDAVITVPAYFSDAQRQATKDAGKIAGLNVLRIINEPTSAALSYGLDHGETQKVMVYDLGGGTFDVSVIEIADGVIEVLSTAGDNHLGGDDFDLRITDWMIQEFKTQYGVDLSKDPMVYRRVQEAAEHAKVELSSSETTNINLPFITQQRGEALHLDLTLTRAQFQSLVNDLVERTAGPVQQALSDAGISASDLGRVLLVGGSTRMPIVQQKVRSMTGKEPSKNINPDECVAMGASILASTLTGNALTAAGTGQDLLLMDVTPMSLSIETVGGVATRLIERNTTLPTRYSRVFSTVTPFQKTVEIKVLQGERPMAKDNKLIGSFRLKGLKRASVGMPQIEVTFDIDANGILMVSAQDEVTGKNKSITITANDRMTDEEIEKAMNDARMYAGQDAMRREALDLIQESNVLIHSVERSLKAGGKEIDKAQQKQIKSDVKNLQKCVTKTKVDKITREQVDTMKTMKEALENSSAEIRARYDAE